MGELLQFPDKEREKLHGLASLMEVYFPDDKEFVLDMDFEDALGFVYGQLLEEGEDPMLILHEFGVTEAADEL